MTAIYGLWRRGPFDEAPDFERLEASGKRYGNRPSVRWQAPGLSLGRCLFSLLPEDHLGEPLECDEGRFAVTADVLLSEREDLARQIGCDPAVHSDADLVALALEIWRDDAFERIYGPFAIAAWDRLEQRLLLARDMMGERPLFYHVSEDKQKGKLCAFASMPAILLSVPDIPSTPAPDQYAHFLRSNHFAPGRTAYCAIREVQAGGLLVLSCTGREERAWWKPDLTPFEHKEQAAYERELAVNLEAGVRAAMRCHATKIGAHLSGGFDSTAVATTAARLLAIEGKRLTAYVAVPREGPLTPVADHCFSDEGPFAEATAQAHPNIDLVKVRSAHGPLNQLDQVNDLYPSPIPNLCNLTWYHAINDRAREDGVKIILTGSMGNFTISESGTLALPWLFLKGRWVLWFRIGRALVANRWMRWRGVLWNSVAPFAPLWLWKLGERISGRPPAPMHDCSLLSRESFAELGAEVRREAREAGLPAPMDDEYDRDTEVDSVRTRLEARGRCDAEYKKAMLGEWGIELRDPTADRRLFEWSLRVPVERLIWNGEPRAILRAVLADRVPDKVRNTRLRGRQGADWAGLLDQDRVRLVEQLESLRDHESFASLMDRDAIQRLIDEMPASGSDDWISQEAETAYRNAALNTISIASHLRRNLGVNH